MTADSPIEIALAANDAVFDGLLVSACSIAKFANPASVLSFNILDGGITDPHYSELTKHISRLHPNAVCRRLRITESDFDEFPPYHGCKMTYARLLLPSLLPETKHVIYCDTDFLWVSDVSELWAQCDNEHALISARDKISVTERNERAWFTRNGLDYPTGRYFCAGLCVFNLELFRNRGIIQKLNQFIREHQDLELPDQTALNVVLQDSLKLVDDRWQTIPRAAPETAFEPPLTLHYAGENPWRASFATQMLSDAQLLWFHFDASIRGGSVWQSLRRYYSATFAHV